MNARAAVMSGKPKFISTFCGTGGSSLGYKWAGFEELLAIDFDPHAVACFKLNFPDVPIWHRSVIDVTAQEILKFTGLKCGELDLFDGSPPCQGFSTAGKRVVSDPRNDLFNHYARLVSDLQPKVFVMENVSGMIKGSMKGKFIEIMNVLKTMNYHVKAKLMNAMYYGVPQSRERMIFIGVRKDLKKEPVFPIPGRELITARLAIHNVKPQTMGRPLATVASNVWKNIKPGENGTKYRPGYYFNAVKVHPDRPCPTLPKSTAGTAQHMHWSEMRGFSIEELCALCSFPIDWKFVGTYEQKHNRLGNAVMPKFMQAIAETIRKEILNGDTNVEEARRAPVEVQA